MQVTPPSETRPPVLVVTCVRCERLHVPVALDHSHPVCPGCRPPVGPGCRPPLLPAP